MTEKEAKIVQRKITLFGILFAAFIVLFIAIISLSISVERNMIIQSVLMSTLFQSTGNGLSEKNNLIIIGKDGVMIDARVEIVRQFLAKYNSPLEPYAPQLVAAADREGIHYGLLPAIAMVESGLCRHIPTDSFNCWGWGIYGRKVTRFASFGEAIDVVARGLKKNYVDKGLRTPEQIVRNYNPTNTNDWSGSVRFFYNFFE